MHADPDNGGRLKCIEKSVLGLDGAVGCPKLCIEYFLSALKYLTAERHRMQRLQTVDGLTECYNDGCATPCKE